jgi:hypothetical protein
MANYQPLVARAVANLQSTSTVAARDAIYERLRKAQGAQLGTLRSPLAESKIAREKEALDQAIALIEAQFRGTKEPPLAATTLAARTNAAGTEVSIPPLPRLAKVDPSCAGSEKSKSWLWLPLAAVLGALLVIAGAGIVMRQKPQYVAVGPPAAQPEAAPQQPAKITQQAQLLPNSTPPAASLPTESQPIAQSGAELAKHAPDKSNSVVPGTARAAVLIASDNPRTPVVSLGSTVWSTIPPVPEKPATLAVKADTDIPDLKMHATMTLRKTTDPTLQATHTIDLRFSFANGAQITGVKDVEPKMRNLGPTPSEALTGARVKISDVYFLIALAKGDQDAARNLDLMQTRAWFDFPLLLNDNRIAKLVFEKSTLGEAMLAKAFEAWK